MTYRQIVDGLYGSSRASLRNFGQGRPLASGTADQAKNVFQKNFVAHALVPRHSQRFTYLQLAVEPKLYDTAGAEKRQARRHGRSYFVEPDARYVDYRALKAEAQRRTREARSQSSGGRLVARLTHGGKA